MLLVGQGLEALPGLGRQLVKGLEGHAAVTGSRHLGGQGIGLVPVVFRGLRQLLQGIGGHIQPQILGNGTGVVIEAEQGRMEAIDGAEHRQHPAPPLDGVPLEDHHEHNAAKDQGPQGHCQQLPQAQIHLAAPLGQNALQIPCHVGVDHIHDGREPLGVGHQHPGNGPKDPGGQISA